MNRVVITGYGVVTAVGAGKQALVDALLTNRSGVAPVTSFDTSGCRCKSAAEVPLDASPWVSRADTFLAMAADEALADAALDPAEKVLRVFQGTAHGRLDRWLVTDRPCEALPANLGDSTWQRVARRAEITTVTTACVASTYAAGLAINAIRQGEVELALVAGAEGFSRYLFHGFESLRSLTSSHCRPFDRRRDGLVLGEGAAVLVLESEQAARRRGARIRAELGGFGAAADANHLTAPDPSGKGVMAALSRALTDAGVVTTVDYINLHGTGTVHNDRMEINAIKRLFGADAGAIQLSSTKAVTGHTSGAAGAVELAICLGAIEYGFIPSTLGLGEPDPMCHGLDFVVDGPKSQRCDVIATVNSAFGGNNAALILRRYS